MSSNTIRLRSGKSRLAHQPVHSSSLFTTLKLTALRQLRRRSHIGRVTIVFLQHRCAGPHVLRQNELMDAFLKPVQRALESLPRQKEG